MTSYKTVIKFFIVGILVFLLFNTSSLGLDTDSIPSGDRQEPIPTVFGVLGNNQWFISDVIIIFSYDPERVEEIQYYLYNTWHVYVFNNPIEIEEDNVYMMPWFWVDEENNTNYGGPLEFKIDKTAPTMELTRKSGGKNKVIFTADAIDVVSSIEKVEFYLDDILQLTDDETPYEYTWTGEEKQVVYAIGYNYAGLLEKSNNLSTEPRSHFRNHNLINLIFVLIQKTFFRFY